MRAISQAPGNKQQATLAGGMGTTQDFLLRPKDKLFINSLQTNYSLIHFPPPAGFRREYLAQN